MSIDTVGTPAEPGIYGDMPRQDLYDWTAANGMSIGELPITIRDYWSGEVDPRRAAVASFYMHWRAEYAGLFTELSIPFSQIKPEDVRNTAFNTLASAAEVSPKAAAIIEGSLHEQASIVRDVKEKLQPQLAQVRDELAERYYQLIDQGQFPLTHEELEARRWRTDGSPAFESVAIHPLQTYEYFNRLGAPLPGGIQLDALDRSIIDYIGGNIVHPIHPFPNWHTDAQFRNFFSADMLRAEVHELGHCYQEGIRAFEAVTQDGIELPAVSGIGISRNKPVIGYELNLTEEFRPERTINESLVNITSAAVVEGSDFFASVGVTPDQFVIEDKIYAGAWLTVVRDPELTTALMAAKVVDYSPDPEKYDAMGREVCKLLELPGLIR